MSKFTESLEAILDKYAYKSFKDEGDDVEAFEEALKAIKALIVKSLPNEKEVNMNYSTFEYNKRLGYNSYRQELIERLGL